MITRSRQASLDPVDPEIKATCRRNNQRRKQEALVMEEPHYDEVAELRRQVQAMSLMLQRQQMEQPRPIQEMLYPTHNYERIWSGDKCTFFRA